MGLDQGGLITAVRDGFENYRNTSNIADLGYIVNWYHHFIDLEPEWFRAKGTTTAMITFNEQQVGNKAETIQVQILYEIQESS